MPALSQLSGGLPELFREAAEQTAQGSRSFYLASRFFPREIAQAAQAVYWFCRYTDDLVDECESIAQGRRNLEEWRQALVAAVAGTDPSHPVLRIFVYVAERYEIPFELAFELIEGMRMDLNGTRYADFEELRVFCYRVASVVGLMMCSVIGFKEGVKREEAWRYAIDLGIAMQLTNIMRDVAEDLQRGRIYLPKNEMEQAGYTESDLQAHRCGEPFVQLMKLQAQRAHAFYGRGNAGIAMLHRRGRFAVKIASDVYGEILDVIEHSNYDVFSRRIIVPASRKHWIVLRNLADPLLRQVAV